MKNHPTAEQYKGGSNAGKKPPANDEVKQPAQGKAKFCTRCKKPGHTADKCWFRDGGPGKPIAVPGGNENKKQRTGAGSKPVMYSQQQVNAMLAALPMFQGTTKPARKRSVTYASSDEDEDVNPSAAAFFSNKLVHFGNPTSEQGDLLYSISEISLARTQGIVCSRYSEIHGILGVHGLLARTQRILGYIRYLYSTRKDPKISDAPVRVSVYVQYT